jgi:hypothetical protein
MRSRGMVYLAVDIGRLCLLVDRVDDRALRGVVGDVLGRLGERHLGVDSGWKGLVVGVVRSSRESADAQSSGQMGL